MLRSGAQRMLAAALEAEVAAYLAQHESALDESGRRLVVRNGHYCDTTGAGEPVFESLRAAGVYGLPYPFSQKSKAALVDNLSLLLEQRLLTLPRPGLWPEGIDELEAFQYSLSDTGSVRTSAPSGAHDDCVMALALAAWHLPPERRGIQIWSLR